MTKNQATATKVATYATDKTINAAVGTIGIFAAIAKGIYKGTNNNTHITKLKHQIKEQIKEQQQVEYIPPTR